PASGRHPLTAWSAQSATASVGSHRRVSASGKPKGKYAPVSNRALNRHATLLELGEQSRDGETESGAAQLAAPRLVDPEEAVEDELEMLCSDPGSRVLHGHADHAIIAPETEANFAL